MRTPIRYAGGKSKAFDFISTYIPFWPRPKEIVSPFLGGGSLEVRWASEMGIPGLGFDVFWCLTNYWKNQLNNPREIYEVLYSLECSKDSYKKIKEELQQWTRVQDLFTEWPTDYYKRDQKDRMEKEDAAYYIFDLHVSYGPIHNR